MVIWGVCVCVSPSIPHAKVCVFVKGQYLSQSGRQLALSSCHADFRALPPRRGRVAGSAGDLDLTPSLCHQSSLQRLPKNLLHIHETFEPH